MTALAWVVLLVVVGLVALGLEVFVPSGGLLGFLSVLALVNGVVLAFIEQGPWCGAAVLAITCVAAPAVLATAFRFFPDTPIGRRVLPPPPRPEEVVPDADRRAALRGLIGSGGLTTTELLPWGRIEVGGVAHEAVSEGGPIAAGVAVVVVGVQAAALVVRGAPREAPSAAAADPPGAVPRGLEEALEHFDFTALDRGPPPETTFPPGELDSPGTANNP